MTDIFIKYAPTMGTMFFFITFCYVVFSVFKKDAKKKFDKYSQMPLEDSNNETSKNEGLENKEQK